LYRRPECSVLRATQSFHLLSLFFLQLETAGAFIAYYAFLLCNLSHLRGSGRSWALSTSATADIRQANSLNHPRRPRRRLDKGEGDAARRQTHSLASGSGDFNRPHSSAPRRVPNSALWNAD